MDLTLDVRPVGAVVDDTPDRARATLTDVDITRIRGLARFVQALDAIYGDIYGIEVWDASPHWLSGTEQEAPESACEMELSMLHVTVEEFYWTAYERHCDTRVETLPVLIKDLQIPDRPEATAQVAV